MSGQLHATRSRPREDASTSALYIYSPVALYTLCVLGLPLITRESIRRSCVDANTSKLMDDLRHRLDVLLESTPGASLLEAESVRDEVLRLLQDAPGAAEAPDTPLSARAPRAGTAKITRPGGAQLPNRAPRASSAPRRAAGTETTARSSTLRKARPPTRRSRPEHPILRPEGSPAAQKEVVRHRIILLDRVRADGCNSLSGYG